MAKNEPKTKIFNLADSLSWKLILLFLITLLLLPPLPVLSNLKTQSREITTNKQNIGPDLKKINLSPYPKRILSSPLPHISAKSFYIQDLSTKVAMISKNKNSKLPMASLTKLMTAWTAIKIYPLKKTIRIKVDGQNVDGQKIDLRKGEEYSLESLIAGMIIHSANDAAINIAAAYPSGISGFVNQMNRQAKLLHMDRTHFTNPVGFDNKNHYTTSHDLSLLVDKVLENPLITAFAQAPMMRIVSINTNRVITLTTTNDLLGTEPGILGLKTGWTPLAGECLISLIKSRTNNWYVTIVLGSSHRFKDTLQLRNWVNANFDWQKINEQNN